MYLLSQGHTVESIADIPLVRKLALSRLLAEGVIGWRRDALEQYQQYSILSSLRNILMSLAGGRRSPIKSFKELHPLIEEMARLGKEKDVQSQLKEFREKWRVTS